MGLAALAPSNWTGAQKAASACSFYLLAIFL
jgi:hypothetical protein